MDRRRHRGRGWCRGVGASASKIIGGARVSLLWRFVRERMSLNGERLKEKERSRIL